MATTAPPPEPSAPRKVCLHPAQQKFLRSEALFRAFCGGIGSGKSWAGSYDLIRRAKPGRLYLVVAPTYSMLSDSSLRLFLGLAQEPGIVEPSEVKRSAPPSVRLRTGAEVLFRSADEPERLRGPNLSGVWLDEASLMPPEVFPIASGRLREAGEQGWLTATFTPKGRLHWTFEVFATGRPDTALSRARTRDNPFLPAGFHDTVRRQYTSELSAQELEGQFLDAGGVLFRRDWFAVVGQAPPLRSLVRAWDLAATPKDEDKANDPGAAPGRRGRARPGQAAGRPLEQGPPGRARGLPLRPPRRPGRCGRPGLQQARRPAPAILDLGRGQGVRGRGRRGQWPGGGAAGVLLHGAADGCPGGGARP
jgi:hypothetical protein